MRGVPSAVAERFSEPPKGEITLVLGPADRLSDAEDEEHALAALDELVSAGLGATAGGRPRRPAHRDEPEHALPALSVTKL